MKLPFASIVAAAIGLAPAASAWAQQSGTLAATPQMGWNSCN
jgi:hypothetical protein